MKASHLIRLISNSFSLFGSSFIILSFLFFKNLRKLAFKLIFLMTISDFIFSVSIFLIFEDANSKNPDFCKLQALLLYFSSMSTIFWTTIIAYNLFQIVTKHDKKSLEKKMVLFCFLGYCIPLLISLVPLIMQKYGPQSFLTDHTNNWCGIVRDGGGNDEYAELLDFLLRFVPILLCFCLNLVLYYQVGKHFRTIVSKSSLLITINAKIKFFPVIPVFCWFIEMVVFRILEAGDLLNTDDTWLYVLEILDSLLIHSQGFLNFMLYGMTKDVKREWMRLIFRKEFDSEEFKSIDSQRRVQNSIQNNCVINYHSDKESNSTEACGGKVMESSLSHNGCRIRENTLAINENVSKIIGDENGREQNEPLLQKK